MSTGEVTDEAIMELGVSSPEDGDVRSNEMNCMRLVSHILQKVT